MIMFWSGSIILCMYAMLWIYPSEISIPVLNILDSVVSFNIQLEDNIGCVALYSVELYMYLNSVRV